MRLPSSTDPVLFIFLFFLAYLALPKTAVATIFEENAVSPNSSSWSADAYRTRILSTGQLSLYRYVTDGPAVPFQESYAPDTAQEATWFLLKEDTNQKVQVTRYNYKSVLQLLLSDRPNLLQKLGKKGYRFSDIQSIVEEYNQKW